MNTSKSKPSLAAIWRQFHEDEAGVETVEAVLILGVGAVVLLVLWKFWGRIKNWVEKFIKGVEDIKEVD